MFKIIIAVLFLALGTTAQAQQPTPHQIVKLALGLGEGNIDRAYDVYGKKLGTVDVLHDTTWAYRPVRDSIGAVVDSVRFVHNTTTKTTPRPAYAWEILSHWRDEVITSWKKARRDSLEAEAMKTVQEPSF